MSGSKNATLPILCATLLTDDECVIENVPDIQDIRSMLAILKSLGSEVEFLNNTVRIKTSEIDASRVPEDMICGMRASILLLGPLLARTGEARVAYPGGCVLGRRPISAHTIALRQIGCEILDETHNLHLRANRLKAAKITMSELSVTATENIVMAACLAEGETEVRLAASEPHVQDFCQFLNKMGAQIKGIGTNFLKINGVQKLHGARHEITGDYLEAGTFAIAAAITNGDVEITGCEPDHLDSLWQKMAEIGVNLEISKSSARVKPHAKPLKATKILRTAVYPSFPTDLQAPFTVLLSQAEGVSKIFETLFEGRLNYLFELEKMGAKVEILNPHQAIVIGPTPLHGMEISSCDIRAGAAMVIAALAAEGETRISNIKYIDRGYDKLAEKLLKLGADIERVSPKVDFDRKSGGLDLEDRSDKFHHSGLEQDLSRFQGVDD